MKFEPHHAPDGLLFKYSIQQNLKNG